MSDALNGYSISFAYNSGNIENPNIRYSDTREIFEHNEVTNYTGDLRTLFEIRNAKNADEYFPEAFTANGLLDEKFIKKYKNCLLKILMIQGYGNKGKVLVNIKKEVMWLAEMKQEHCRKM